MKAALHRARQLLESAEALHRLGDYHSAVSSGYDATFPVVRALPRAEGLQPKTHVATGEDARDVIENARRLVAHLADSANPDA